MKAPVSQDVETEKTAGAQGIFGAIDRAHGVLSTLYFQYQRKIGPYASQALGAARALTQVRDQLKVVEAALRLAERHCPCGARPEALDTHPHVAGCQIAAALQAFSSTTMPRKDTGR